MRSITAPSTAGVRIELGENAPMPPVFGPTPAGPTRCVILRGGECRGSAIRPSTKAKKLVLLAGEKILDDTPSPAALKRRSTSVVINAWIGGVEIFGDDDALAAGEARLRLDDRQRACTMYFAAADRGKRRWAAARSAHVQRGLGEGLEAPISRRAT